MGEGKRKRGDSTGPSITPLGGKASAADTAIKLPAVVLEQSAASAASAPQAALSVLKQRPSHTVHASQGLRQYTATGQAFQFSGNHAGHLKVQYLAQIANWACTAVPSLGACYWQRLAAATEALSIPPPTPHSLCQRCESILHGGDNCSVRVTKAPKKWRKSKENVARISAIASPMVAAQTPLASSSASVNATAQATGGGTKRKRKGWSTLKDMTTAKAEPATPASLGFMSPNEKD
ncbi:hypothetical protein MPTK1_7g06190 [Marchantia polymorpha subsp. ruderalis]|nr:hypothetical protein MARPO_0057s0052 [Marchantia polymorpha]BBN16427.1 hypothetical protein Mp_7g06190 [Marchantia polymorpha subsp. ruderalis]|eukprot:PTQ37415.1 hypothetical protein MARPO_0057s0052 [Marchantia polymorpha]